MNHEGPPVKSTFGTGNVRISTVLWYGLPCMVVWTVYLLAFWPGILNVDSCVQWEEMVTGEIHDWHPPFQTLTNWVLTRLWFSPGFIALSQIAMVGLAIGWGLAKLRSHGLPGLAAGALCLIFALSPVNAAMSITLVKDVPFSAALLVLSVMIFDIVETRGERLRGWTSFVPLGCVVALVSLYRHDGVIPAFGGGVVLLLFARNRRLKLLAALCLGAAIWLIVTGPVYRAARVRFLEPVSILFPVMHQIAAHLAAGTPLRSDEREFLERAMPRNAKTGKPYDCASNLELSPEGNWPFIWQHKSKFVEIFWALALRDPSVSLRHQACLSSYIWQPFRPPDRFFETSVSYLNLDDHGRVLSVYPYTPEYTSMNDSKLPRLQLPLARFMGMDPVNDPILHQGMPYLHWVGAPLRPKTMLIWQPALYFYLLIFSVVLACLRRREWSPIAAGAPVFIYVFFLAIMGHTLSFRFMFGLSLVSLMFIGLPLLKIYSPTDRKGRDAAPYR